MTLTKMINAVARSLVVQPALPEDEIKPDPQELKEARKRVRVAHKRWLRGEPLKASIPHPIVIIDDSAYAALTSEEAMLFEFHFGPRSDVFGEFGSKPK